MRRFLACVLLCGLLQSTAPTPLHNAKDALDFKNEVWPNPGQHSAHNIIGTPHEAELHQEENPSSEDLHPYVTHPDSDGDIPPSDPPSPAAPHPEERTPELPRYVGWEMDPDTVIDKDSRFGHKLIPLGGWRKTFWEKLKRVGNWLRNIFDISPRRFSSKKPHRELYFKTDTNLATKIVLDGNQIKGSAEDIKSDVIDELKSFILKSGIGSHDEENEAVKLLEEFSQIKDITKWEEASSEEPQTTHTLVENIIASMKNEVKSSSDSGRMIVDLQVMKCLGYVNANAGDYFLEHIFEKLTDGEVERMWRALLDSEAEFQTGEKQALSPGRYNNFLEQLHFEWAETIERRAHIRDLQAAIDREEVPEELKRDIIKLKDAFSRLQMWKSWPLIDKGYYENSFSVISKIKEILRHPVTRSVDDREEHVSKTVQLAYHLLNHIYRFDLQTKRTPKWLIDTLDDKEVQKSLYLHVLSNEGLSHRNVAGMSLLNDFNLKAHLDKSMQEYLTQELDSKFYSVLSSEIVKEHEMPHMQAGDNKIQNYSSTKKQIAGTFAEGSFRFDDTFKSMIYRFSQLKDEDVITEERPDYRLAMKLDAESKREDLREITPPAILEKDTQASKSRLEDFSQDHTQTSKERISNAVHAVLENLKKFSNRKSTDPLEPEEKASIEILNSLISFNYLAWHLTRSGLKDSPDESLLKYFEVLGIRATRPESSEEGIIVEKHLNFMVDMTQEIGEYEKIQTTTKRLNEILKAKSQSSNKPGDITPFFLQQYSGFLERLSQTWFETRWTRVDGGGYDVNIVDLAKESLALIESQAFAHMPKGLDTEFVHVLSDLDEKDPTGFFRKYYQDAVSDTTNYSTYQFFTRALSQLKNPQVVYPEKSPEAKSLAFFKALKPSNPPSLDIVA